MTKKSNSKSESKPQVFTPNQDQSSFKKYSLIGFLVLLGGIIIVVVILPAQVDKADKNTQPFTETLPTNKIPDAQVQAKAKEAQELLNTILERQARLENNGVQIWGAEKMDTSYEEILTSLAGADLMLKNLQYDQAIKNYREVADQLEKLEASREQRFDHAMAKGYEAFNELKGLEAAGYYTVAVAASPGSKEAQTALQRAENLSEVLELIREGERLEKNGEIVMAKQMYYEASQLDKNYQPALDHYQRLDALITDVNFRAFMTKADSALKEKDIKVAQEALVKAQKLKPTSSGVQDLNQQLNNLAMNVDFQNLGQAALKHEMAEEWQMADKIYKQILNKDPNAGFAQEGKKRTENLLAIQKQMQDYMDKPEQLQDQEHMNQARELFLLANAQTDVGPNFIRQTQALNSLMTEYSQPVTVLIQSDNLTDVTIYRVARLGLLARHKLILLPGKYKAVGRRSGYRDVSVPFTVPAGKKEMIVSVLCKEKI